MVKAHQHQNKEDSQTKQEELPGFNREGRRNETKCISREGCYQHWEVLIHFKDMW